MYKIIGIVVFIFILIWNVSSGNHQLVKKLSLSEDNATRLSSEILLRDELITKYKRQLLVADMKLDLLNTDIIVLRRDLNISRNKKPIIKWRTEYKTNPQYVKCIDK